MLEFIGILTLSVVVVLALGHLTGFIKLSIEITRE